MYQFSKRHYVWLASFARDVVRKAKEREYEWGETEDLEENAQIFVRDLADALADENPTFSRSQFLHNVFCDPGSHTLGLDCPHVTAHKTAAE